MSDTNDTRKACKNCPFRADSSEGFCEDGQQALADGCEPSCHELVGRGKQFFDVLPSEKTRCIGFDNWLEAVPGFVQPKNISVETVLGGI